MTVRSTPHVASGRPVELVTETATLRGWTLGERQAPKPPVLFVHPINLQGAVWAKVAAAVAGERFCLLPDLRGHGRSSAAGPFGVDEWVGDLRAVLDHFDVERCHVVGGSLGGPLAVALAVREPHRVLSVAAFGSALALEGDDLEAVFDVLAEKGVRQMFDEVIPEISVAPGTPPAVVAEILQLTNPNDARTVADVWRATISTDVHHLAGGVAVPALVATGELDRTCPQDQGRRMAAALRTELVTLPGVGHLPMAEAPVTTAELLRGFLAEADP